MAAAAAAVVAAKAAAAAQTKGETRLNCSSEAQMIVQQRKAVAVYRIHSLFLLVLFFPVDDFVPTRSPL